MFSTTKEKYLGKWIDNTGYYQCILRDDNGKRCYKRIHRLVAEAFIPNPNNLPQVNHKDTNKLNCDVSNLEWSTNSENTQHGYNNKCYMFKSRSHPVNVYKKDGTYLKTYPSIRSMCDDLPVNRKTVTNILKGEKTTNNYDYIFEYVENS